LFCRENELLKHQLRKYVAAVQMLNRDGSSAHQTLANLAPAINQVVLEESRIQQENEASQYEHKLIQVSCKPFSCNFYVNFMYNVLGSRNAWRIDGIQ
jgi:hypothetical protein